MPPRLTLGEARSLGPRQIRVGSQLPVRDGSVDIVFHSRAKHILVEEPYEEAQAAGQVVVVLVDSSEADTEDPNEEMVVRQNMTADRFFPGGRPTV